MNRDSIICYAHAADHLGTKCDRPLGHRGVRLIRRDHSTIAVRYYKTDIITYHADDSITLDIQRHYTRSTIALLDEYTPYRYGHDSAVVYVYVNGQKYGYKDGMHVAPDGTVTGAATAEEITAAYQLRADIKRYVARYTDAVVQALGASGEWGNDEDDCLLEYMQTPYLSQAIMYRAFEVCGMRDAWARTCIERGDGAQVRRYLRRYLYAALRAGMFSGIALWAINGESYDGYGF